MRLCFRVAVTLGIGSAAVLASGLPGREDAPRSVKSVIRTDRRTGKLVRIVVPPAAPQPHTAPPQTPSQTPAADALGVAPAFKQAVEMVAAEQSVPPELIHSVIKVESDYNPFAVSPKGARGLMQLIPSTARRFGVTDVFDPLENLKGGAKYLKYLLELYNGNYTLALAAYNAGEGAVARYGDVPPYPETRDYVVKVSKHLEAARTQPPAVAEAKLEKPAEVRETGPAKIEEIVDADGTVRYVSR